MTSELILEDDAPEDEAENAEEQKPTGLSRKKKLIIAALLGLVVFGGGSFALMRYLGGESEPKLAAPDSGTEHPVYVEVPPIIVNLRGSDGSARFLKLKLTLVTDNEGKAEEIKLKLPMVLDGFQPFLRELRPEDLAGSAAIFRLKEEMLTRASAALGGDVAKDVLIQELVQQ